MNDLHMGRPSPLFIVPGFSDELTCPRYARIETLSGFANGIFLVLISIFIIFEAIERLWVFFPTTLHLIAYEHRTGWIRRR